MKIPSPAVDQSKQKTQSIFSPKRWRLWLLLLPASISLIVSGIFFTISLNRAPMGVVFSRVDQNWEVTMLDANGLAHRVGIRIGDVPIEINHQPAEAFLKTVNTENTVFGNMLTELVTVNKDGKITVADSNTAPPSAESIIELFAFIAISFVFFATGFYVFRRKPENQAAIILFICGVIVALALSANAAGSRAVMAATEIAVVTTIVGPWLLVHFFLILPEERSQLRNQPLLYLMYIPAMITLILFPIIGYVNGNLLSDFHTFRIIETGLAFLMAAVMAFVNFFTARSQRTRQQMQIVLVSCVIAIVPILVLNLLPQAIRAQPIIPPGFSFLPFAFIPIGMGYAIITQKLMDIDVVIRRGIIYGLITVVMSTIVSAAFFIMGAVQPLGNVGQEIAVAVTLGAAATLLFGPAKKGIELLVDKFFYKDRYDHRKTIQTLATSLSAQREFTDMSRVIVGAAVQTLNLAGACLFVRGQAEDLEVTAAQGTLIDGDRQSRLLAVLEPSKRNRGFEFPNSAAEENPDIEFLVPFIAGDKEVGILCLSPKANRQDFSADDLFLIQELATVGATSLRSALLSHDVSMRDTFVSIASHELLTPLTSVLGYSELLLSHETDARKQKWASVVSENAQNMSKIVNDLLNVSRIQSGKIGLKLDRVKVEEVLADRITFAEANSEKHNFVLEIEADLPDIYVDREKFSQAIWNLLSNAIKYSPNGGLITTSTHTDATENFVVICVADQGMGISAADAESLFKTFHRIQRPETVGIKGSGLGLYIVKEWIQAMGGQVWLESELNTGSKFYVTVPIFRPSQSPE